MLAKAAKFTPIQWFTIYTSIVLIIGIATSSPKEVAKPIVPDWFDPYVPQDPPMASAPYLMSEHEVECLAKNMFFEARGEGPRGKLAVALVTFSRVRHSEFPDTICEVVYEKRTKPNGKVTAQFSWTIDHIPNSPPSTKNWRDTLRLAQMFTADGGSVSIKDFTYGALFYHADYVKPNWKFAVFRVKIGNHLFYNLKKDVVS